MSMADNNDRKQYDVVVMGAGPAGYVAAIRCAQLGMKTACVDEWSNCEGETSLGGTCLNVGCIPSKALLESSHLYAMATHAFADHGIGVSAPRLDLATMMARKNRIVSELTQGIAALFKSNQVDLFHGHARIAAGRVVNIKDRRTREVIESLQAQHIIIATGSSPVVLPRAELHDDRIVDSAGALAFDTVPSRLGIVGAGVIGLELGSVWSRLGSEVVLLETLDEFLPVVDKQIARAALRLFKKQGLDIRLEARLVCADVDADEVSVVYEDEQGEHRQNFDRLIVAVGRKPNSDLMFDAEMEIELDERCFILVNEHCETSSPGIYAIGDVVRGPMLAHKAMEEGIMVAERIAGQQTEVNYDNIPGVIYTHPEIAWTGKTEQQCRQLGIEIKTGVFPMAASGRARAMGASEGMVKIISHAQTDRVLGVHILAANASELIAQAVTAIEMQCSTEDIQLTMFAHPTLSEAIHEAALAADGHAIHIKNSKSNKPKSQH